MHGKNCWNKRATQPFQKVRNILFDKGGKVIYCMLISLISKVRFFPARGGLKSTVTVVSVTLVIVPVIVVPSV